MDGLERVLLLLLGGLIVVGLDLDLDVHGGLGGASTVLPGKVDGRVIHCLVVPVEEQFLLAHVGVHACVEVAVGVNGLDAVHVVLDLGHGYILMAETEAALVSGSNDPLLLFDVLLKPLHLISLDFQQLDALLLDPLQFPLQMTDLGGTCLHLFL